MPNLKLRATSAELSTGIGLLGLAETDEWNLALTANLDGTLKVTTGERIEDFVIYVTLKRHPNGVMSPWPVTGYDKKAIGELCYFEGHTDGLYSVPPTLIFQVYIGEAEMRTLLEFARHGRFPRKISIDVEGVEYDWQPDGSGTKWDNAAEKRVPVTAINFSIPVTDEPVASHSPPDPSEPKTPVGVDLIPELRKLAQWQQWTLYFLLALGAILLFRR
jgi:hypothetical protein